VKKVCVYGGGNCGELWGIVGNVVVGGGGGGISATDGIREGLAKLCCCVAVLLC